MMVAGQQPMQVVAGTTAGYGIGGGGAMVVGQQQPQYYTTTGQGVQYAQQQYAQQQYAQPQYAQQQYVQQGYAGGVGGGVQYVQAQPQAMSYGGTGGNVVYARQQPQTMLTTTGQPVQYVQQGQAGYYGGTGGGVVYQQQQPQIATMAGQQVQYVQAQPNYAGAQVLAPQATGYGTGGYVI